MLTMAMVFFMGFCRLFFVVGLFGSEYSLDHKRIAFGWAVGVERVDFCFFQSIRIIGETLFIDFMHCMAAAIVIRFGSRLRWPPFRHNCRTLSVGVGDGVVPSTRARTSDHARTHVACEFM